MKKKVLLVTLRSDFGGGPQHVLDLLEYSKDTDIEFYIASPLDNPFGQKFKTKAKGFFELPHRRFSFKHLLGLIAFIKKNGITTTHSHGRGAGIYSRLMKLTGQVVIHTFHGVHTPTNITEKLKIKIENILVYLSDKLLFVSNSEQSQAKRLGIHLGSKSRVIPNGIALNEDSKPLPSKNSISQIGILSRFDPHKNLLRALELFSKIKESYPELHLNIAGDGEQRGLIEKKILELNLSQSTTLHGFISTPLEFLREQDIYLSTSHGEGLPYTVLEAMSSNTIPLLSNVSGHKDILDERYLFDSASESDFLKKFINLQEGKIEHNFKALLKENFEIKSQIKKVLEVYYEN